MPDDPFHGRRPTSHERLTGRPWDASYHDGPAPWDAGGPQPAIVRLASDGGFNPTVLDVGCGTGANAVHLALDCDLFHTFDATERKTYVANLSSVLKDEGVVHVLCFSDAATPDTGGVRITSAGTT